MRSASCARSPVWPWSPSQAPLDRGIDAILRFTGNQVPIAVEFKRRANPATAWQLVHYPRDQPNVPRLLIAGETTADARQILENHGIAHISGRWSGPQPPCWSWPAC
jgi:hypothetical protein